MINENLKVGILFLDFMRKYIEFKAGFASKSI